MTARRPTRTIGGQLHLYCKDCQRWLPLAMFHKCGLLNDGGLAYKSYCAPCDSIRSKAAYRRRMAKRSVDTRYIACRLCKYPVRRCDLVRGVCPGCDALMDGGMHPDDTEWCDQANNREDHEDIMTELERRKDAGERLFPRRARKDLTPGHRLDTLQHN